MTLVKERQPTGAEKRAARAGVPAGAFSPGSWCPRCPMQCASSTPATSSAIR
jgi:hypothetical protein